VRELDSLAKNMVQCQTLVNKVIKFLSGSAKGWRKSWPSERRH